MDYSTIAKSYNELYSEEQLKKLKIIKSLLKFKKEYKLLDVGCGTGISTNYFSKYCKVKGIDPCRELLDQGKGLIQASAENLPFKDKTFDIIISVTAVHNFDDMEKGIKEIKRVLKSQGQLIISVLKRSKKLKQIEKIIKKEFPNIKQIEEDKDIIFYSVS